jgi:hypothetical protein
MYKIIDDVWYNTIGDLLPAIFYTSDHWPPTTAHCFSCGTVGQVGQELNPLFSTTTLSQPVPVWDKMGQISPNGDTEPCPILLRPVFFIANRDADIYNQSLP